MAAITVPIISEFVSTGLEKANREFENFGKKGKSGLDKIRAAAVPASIALGAITGVVVSAAKGAEEARQANQALANVLDSMGYADATERVQEYADSLELSLGVDADVIKATQTKLATFKGLARTVDDAGSSFDRATLAALDMAAAGFGSAESNAVALGKALEDPIKGVTALARSGVTFTEQERDKIEALVESGDLLAAQNMVLSAIETQVGGTAEASASSFDKIGLSVAALTESVGTALLPVIDAIVPIFQDVAKWASENSTLLVTLVGVVGGLAAGVIAVNAAMTAYKAITTAVTAVTAVFNAVMAVNPIALVVIAIAAVVAGLVLLEKKFGVITKVIEGAKIVFSAIGEALEDAFKAAFNFIARAWNDTVGKLQFDIPSWVPIIGGNKFGVPKIPMLAEGGLVTGPQMAIVGEAGPELIVPLDRVKEMGGGGGDVYNVTVNMPAGSNGDQVVRAIQQYARRTGRTPIATTSKVRK